VRATHPLRSSRAPGAAADRRLDPPLTARALTRGLPTPGGKGPRRTARPGQGLPPSPGRSKSEGDDAWARGQGAVICRYHVPVLKAPWARGCSRRRHGHLSWPGQE
jgi:hypothetical protein